ncbi:hypothetical protein O2K51_00750 [Apibacter raozihei]|uniref:hypothetical protein n=1 Tax=Apibacter raozihei TaxID=2500547 RepID=UPI000FE308E1|nr:hypothetical protein [Apibacter raozihei]
MKKDYLSDFLPEKGYVYFYGIRPKDKDILDVENTFSMYSGYFSDFFNVIFNKYGYDEMPIEFQMYFNAEDYEDNIDESIKIDVKKTLFALENISNSKLSLSDANNCLDDLINFMKEHINEQFRITEV